MRYRRGVVYVYTIRNIHVLILPIKIYSTIDRCAWNVKKNSFARSYRFWFVFCLEKEVVVAFVFIRTVVAIWLNAPSRKRCLFDAFKSNLYTNTKSRLHLNNYNMLKNIWIVYDFYFSLLLFTLTFSRWRIYSFFGFLFTHVYICIESTT